MRRVFLFLAAIMLSTVVFAQTVTITIAYENKEQPPYYMGNTEEVLAIKPGVAVEMVKLLESKIPGLKIKLVRAPWKRCTNDLGLNIYDGIFNASYSKERLAIGWYPTLDNTRDGPVDTNKRITNITYSLYVPRESKIRWDGTKYIDLKEGEQLGAPEGYSIVNDLKNQGVSVLEVSGTINALNMITSNRLPGAVLQDVTADSIIMKDRLKYGSIIKFARPIVSKPYYLMLSNDFVEKNPELAKRIWEAIKEIRETQFTGLVEKYNE